MTVQVYDWNPYTIIQCHLSEYRPYNDKGSTSITLSAEKHYSIPHPHARATDCLSYHYSDVTWALRRLKSPATSTVSSRLTDYPHRPHRGNVRNTGPITSKAFSCHDDVTMILENSYRGIKGLDHIQPSRINVAPNTQAATCQFCLPVPIYSIAFHHPEKPNPPHQPSGYKVAAHKRTR